MPTESKHLMLYLEGRDDMHVVKNLLCLHGIKVQKEKTDDENQNKTVYDVDPSVPELCDKKGKDNVLKQIDVEVRKSKDDILERIDVEVPVSSEKVLGFVLDADQKPQDRWTEVRTRLEKFELDPPKEIPAHGYIADVVKYQSRIGVWLMPDNQQRGALEEFLIDLIPKDDCLLLLAESSTEEAHIKGAKFPKAKRRKAVLHTWLAWQEDPGLRYGLAINAEFFRNSHKSPAALHFVEWYKRLFRPLD